MCISSQPFLSPKTQEKMIDLDGGEDDQAEGAGPEVELVEEAELEEGDDARRCSVIRRRKDGVDGLLAFPLELVLEEGDGGSWPPRR